jgi:hypothetical protein
MSRETFSRSYSRSYASSTETRRTKSVIWECLLFLISATALVAGLATAHSVFAYCAVARPYTIR